MPPSLAASQYPRRSDVAAIATIGLFKATPLRSPRNGAFPRFTISPQASTIHVPWPGPLKCWSMACSKADAIAA